jgi:hypothetical protein
MPRITIHEITEPTALVHRNQLETVLDAASDEARAKNMLIDETGRLHKLALFVRLFSLTMIAIAILQP